MDSEEENANDEMSDLIWSEDTGSEPDAELENQYYNSKGLLNHPKEAIQSFQRVLVLEGDEKGQWGFKALKQLIKIFFKLNQYEDMLAAYRRLLTYIKRAVTLNHSEKSINSILEVVSGSQDKSLLQSFYETTLHALKENNNERLWFKTNTKLAKLYYEMEDYVKMAKVIKQLRSVCEIVNGEEDLTKGTMLLEVLALEIQMYTNLKNTKKLTQLYEQSVRIKSAIPHPWIMGVIRECGGKMHLREGKYVQAHADFFEAFKNYDESGNPRRTTCLKYLVMANMLNKSDINPFDCHQTKHYRSDPEVMAMTSLLGAYNAGDVPLFESVLKEHSHHLMTDPFIRENIQQLVINCRTQVLIKMIQPYNRIKISSISENLNIHEDEVESLLVSCILDDLIKAKIDQVNKVLIIEKPGDMGPRYAAMDRLIVHLNAIQETVINQMI